MYICIPNTDKCKLDDKISFFLYVYSQHLKELKIIIIVVDLFSPQSLELRLSAMETFKVKMIIFPPQCPHSHLSGLERGE